MYFLHNLGKNRLVVLRGKPTKASTNVDYRLRITNINLHLRLAQVHCKWMLWTGCKVLVSRPHKSLGKQNENTPYVKFGSYKRGCVIKNECSNKLAYSRVAGRLDCKPWILSACLGSSCLLQIANPVSQLLQRLYNGAVLPINAWKLTGHLFDGSGCLLNHQHRIIDRLGSHYSSLLAQLQSRFTAKTAYTA